MGDTIPTQNGDSSYGLSPALDYEHDDSASSSVTDDSHVHSKHQSHIPDAEEPSTDAVEHNLREMEGGVGAMSPRRTSEDIRLLGQEAREELQRQAKVLQDSLLVLFSRIEAVREEHDKLDNNNKFLQKYIGDLMSTSKITASGSRSKK